MITSPIERLEDRIAPAAISGAPAFAEPLQNLAAIGDDAGASLQTGAEPRALTQVDARTFTFTDVDGDLITIRTSEPILEPTNIHLVESGAGFQLVSVTVPFSQIATSLKIKAAAAAGGDGFVNVGAILAPDRDLTTVVVDGDLGQIDVGNFDNRVQQAFTYLQVQSLGRYGLSTQGGEGDLVSDIAGSAGPILIAGDLAGKISIVGANPGVALQSLTVQGSLAGDAFGLGSIRVVGATGPITVSGDVRGGDAERSGEISVRHPSPEIHIRGSLLGGSGVESGHIRAKVTYLRIEGDVTGSAEASANKSGSITLNGSTASVVIGGNLTGGAGALSGSIVSTALWHRTVSHISIGGSLVGGANENTGIINSNTIESITIMGDLRGTAAAPAKISVFGAFKPGTAAEARAIGSIWIGGSVEHARIIAGQSGNGDVRIGPVKVVKDWIASDLVAGIRSEDAFFGDDAGPEDNNSVIDRKNSPAIKSALERVVIRGQVLGTPEPHDSFGFVAERIKFFKVNGHVFPLSNGFDNFLVGSTGDVRVREYTSAA